MKTILALLCAVLLLGCENDSSYNQQSKQRTDVKSGPSITPDDQSADPNADRFEVARVKIIHDSLAYGGERGVYLITDKKTGKEFVGLSGVGVSEVGSHQSGKVSVQDEK